MAFPFFNPKIYVNIHKDKDVDSIDKYRPIAFANFKFKIINKKKVLVERLVAIMPTMIPSDEKLPLEW